MGYSVGRRLIINFVADDAQVKKGFNVIEKKLNKTSVEKYLTYLSNLIKQECLSETPVDTGKLKRSFKVVKGSMERILGYGVPYASWVEMGHRTSNLKRWVVGQFFLKKGTTSAMRKAKNITKVS